MDFLSYQEVLKSRGNNLAQARRIQSDENINATFTSDPAYKRVYILTKNGWKFEDAKYQFHSTPSISKDPVDYYLQFRPKVHYPIGSYVFIPDDTNFEINLTEAELKEPFSLPEEKITQLWFLVGRDESLAYVRYNALKCNWNFKWLYKGQIYSCWGANRSANSYTSCNVLSYETLYSSLYWKQYSVCSLIAGTSLKPCKLQHSNEKNTNVTV